MTMAVDRMYTDDGTSTHEARPSWREFAACLGMDTNIFYPEGRGRVLRAREAEAKEICQQCPVRASCESEANEYPERWGVWAGTTERERGWSGR